MQRLLPFQGWRLSFFQGIIFAVFALFAVRMYQLQIVENVQNQARANENRLSEIPVAAPRGTIHDRFDMPLAVNVPAYDVRVTPAELPGGEDDVLRIYNRLSALTGVPPTRAIALASGQNVRSIEELVAEGEGIAPYRPVVIARDVTQTTAMQILEEAYTLPGVDIDSGAVREYPTGELTAQIIGYMGRIPAERELQLIEQGYDPAYDRIGYAGLESYLETELAGQRGRIVNEVDVAGQPIGDPIISVDPSPGLSVRLTLDTQLQAAAEQALRNRIAKINSDAGQIVSQTGSIVALNPTTGEVLAMVSYPSYDNSRFARNIDVDYYLRVASDPLIPLVNHVTQSLYPPGSVWKLITAAGVLEEHVIDPNSTLDDPGSLLLPNKYAPFDEAAAQRFVCWLPQGHGRLNIIGAIAQSCDVYFYQIGGGNPNVSEQVLRPGGLGIDDLFRYATAFGIGSKLGIELPFENYGRMPDQDWKRRLYGQNWSTGDTYNAAFGQGYVNVTPLQLASSVAAIVNGGTLYQPTLIRDYLDANGNVVEPFEPVIDRTVNIDNIPETEPLTLMIVEDMIMKGENSLACVCESDSEFYNPLRCNPDTYISTVNVSPEDLLYTPRNYRVSVPPDYTWSDGICTSLRFDPNYRPAFVSSQNLAYVRQGMRLAVTGGTATTANLSYIEVAGKTGTAEYCDDVARPLGLCKPGNWPAHAWFTAYAPYENPEILILGFIYNGGEGSANALPMVMETMEAYLRLKEQRNTQITPINVEPTNP
ncbi:MAG: penicillin-binding protein 2 [Anaerolineae bacterium]|nr:penicillin-binding protein 2 [Anaerolineae bacterium]